MRHDVTFTVLVPAPPGGKNIRFLRQHPDQEKMAAPGAEDLGTFERKAIG